MPETVSLLVYTARISSPDPDCFDITRKSGTSEFAPSWALLGPELERRREGVEQTEEGWKLYAKRYLEEMTTSYRNHRPAWDAMLARKRVVLTCYCTDSARCHRRILAAILARLGATDRGELNHEELTAVAGFIMGYSIQTYVPSEGAVFFRTREEHGGLSNMSGGFPLVVNGIEIRSSEALYQTFRFPHMEAIQRSIIEQKSPMSSKMVTKPYRAQSRPDWDDIRVEAMRWTVRAKLAQNWAKFRGLLLATEQKPIIEKSNKDDFWGAKPQEDGTLKGQNVLGHLLMELRELVRSGPFIDRVEPPPIPGSLLYGEPIREIIIP